MTPAELWIEALRSENYKQTKGKLSQDRKEFCCLGVACELYIKHVDPEYPTRALDSGAIVYGGDGGHSGNLPGPVLSWLDLRDPNGEYWGAFGFSASTSLMTKNDSGESFLEIARIIESRPKGLFNE